MIDASVNDSKAMLLNASKEIREQYPTSILDDSEIGVRTLCENPVKVCNNIIKACLTKGPISIILLEFKLLF